MKDELQGKLITKFVSLKPKTYCYLTNHSGENRKAKGTRKCTTKIKFTFEDYNHCLEPTQLKPTKKIKLMQS